MNKKQQKGGKKATFDNFAPLVHDQDEAVVNRVQHSTVIYDRNETRWADERLALLKCSSTQSTADYEMPLQRLSITSASGKLLFKERTFQTSFLSVAQ